MKDISGEKIMSKISYKDAGVDKEKGYEEVSLIKEICKETYNDNVLSGVGGFASLYKLDNNIKNPILVSGSDGVGTKLKIAIDMDKHDTVGIDLVAMCANDVICLGATPLYFLDYIATNKLEPKKMAKIVEGIKEGCLQSKAALIGGETAEMSDMYQENEYDLAGFMTGVVDKDKIIDHSKVKEGDVVIALPSNGIHSNGLTLARKIVKDIKKIPYDTYIEELDKTIGEELLTPTRIYVKDILSLLDKININAIANITGGGIYENLQRVLNDKLSAKLDVSNVEIPKIFTLLKDWADIDTNEMYSTFNMGIGMVIVVDSKDKDIAIEHFKDYKAVCIGEIVNGNGEVIL